MPFVDLDDKIHSRICGIIEKNKVKYPSIRFFVNNAVIKELDIIEKTIEINQE